MLVAMVTIFVVCWLPLNLLHIAQDHNAAVMKWHYFLLMFLITHVVAMSSTIYNPFLYAWMNDNFKKEFQLVPLNYIMSSFSDLVGQCTELLPFVLNNTPEHIFTGE